MSPGLFVVFFWRKDGCMKHGWTFETWRFKLQWTHQTWNQSRQSRPDVDHLCQYVTYVVLSCRTLNAWLSWLSQNKFWDVWPMRDPKKVHLFPKHCIWWYCIFSGDLILNMGEVQLPLGWCLFNVLLIQLIYWYLWTVQMFHQNCCRNWYFRPQGIGMIYYARIC